ncbi:MAG TPA: hypothetical protein VH394_24395 [Thermoanaerobaculia bacterium]|jgi:hypothetical protein|nr:hypothetical protein [Thermoanaerobaculia bacterium]
MSTVDTPPSVALVDSHVHFHACYDLPTFLDGALCNFRKAGAGIGYLLLTESAGAHWFRRWRDGLKTKAWGFEPTMEEESLRAVNGAGEKLVLVAGRQIVTRERLEVLALGKDLELPDGLPIREVLEQVRESGALPVLPWGFGKWWGRRGAVVAETLERDGELFLGDNGGRLGPEPALFRRARKLGIRVLPGSDPLPFARHAGLAGSYGFILPHAVDWDRPAEMLLRRIRESGQPRAFGRRAGLPRFLRDQVGMQLRSAEATS